MQPRFICLVRNLSQYPMSQPSPRKVVFFILFNSHQMLAKCKCSFYRHTQQKYLRLVLENLKHSRQKAKKKAKSSSSINRIRFEVKANFTEEFCCHDRYCPYNAGMGGYRVLEVT